MDTPESPCPSFNQPSLEPPSYQMTVEQDGDPPSYENPEEISNVNILWIAIFIFISFVIAVTCCISQITYLYSLSHGFVRSQCYSTSMGTICAQIPPYTIDNSTNFQYKCVACPDGDCYTDIASLYVCDINPCHFFPVESYRKNDEILTCQYSSYQPAVFLNGLFPWTALFYPFALLFAVIVYYRLFRYFVEKRSVIFSG